MASAWFEVPKIMPTFFNKFSEDEHYYSNDNNKIHKKKRKSKSKSRTMKLELCTTDTKRNQRLMIEPGNDDEIMEEIQDKHSKRKTHK